MCIACPNTHKGYTFYINLTQVCCILHWWFSTSCICRVSCRFQKDTEFVFSFKHHDLQLKRILSLRGANNKNISKKKKRILAPYFRRHANNEVLNMCRCGNTPLKRSSCPGTFFSPKRKQKKRSAENITKAITIESDGNDETNWTLTLYCPSTTVHIFFIVYLTIASLIY